LETNNCFKKTPLFKICEKYNARFTSFAGWSLPLQFSGIIQEAKAVRNNAGLFDVSHMGEIEVAGPGACDFLSKMVTNNIRKARPGRAIYTFMCFPDGGTIDDFLIYKHSDEHFFLVVNAVNTVNILDYLKKGFPEPTIKIADRSQDFALLALQGPAANSIMEKVLEPNTLSIKPFRFQTLTWKGQEMVISRTGYTGEDGFEIYLPPTNAEHLWETLMEAGQNWGLLPAGLGARDLLRQEAGLPLYGQELSSQISPVQAGLDKFIDWENPEFSGRTSLLAEQANPLTPKRIGLVTGRGAIPRIDYQVYWEGKLIGKITSGTFSPVLQKGIGMALVNPVPPIGSEISILIRGEHHTAEVTPLPFYQRKR
jgi:aminomethyltransferase